MFAEKSEFRRPDSAPNPDQCFVIPWLGPVGRRSIFVLWPFTYPRLQRFGLVPAVLYTLREWPVWGIAMQFGFVAHRPHWTVPTWEDLLFTATL
jgi:hypothetical protein